MSAELYELLSRVAQTEDSLLRSLLWELKLVVLVYIVYVMATPYVPPYLPLRNPPYVRWDNAGIRIWKRNTPSWQAGSDVSCINLSVDIYSFYGTPAVW